MEESIKVEGLRWIWYAITSLSSTMMVMIWWTMNEINWFFFNSTFTLNSTTNELVTLFAIELAHRLHKNRRWREGTDVEHGKPCYSVCIHLSIISLLSFGAHCLIAWTLSFFAFLFNLCKCGSCWMLSVSTRQSKLQFEAQMSSLKRQLIKKKEEEHERCARMAWGTFAAGIIAELFAIQLFWRVNVKSFRFSF